MFQPLDPMAVKMHDVGKVVIPQRQSQTTWTRIYIASEPSTGVVISPRLTSACCGGLAPLTGAPRGL